ncbi:MAG: 6-phospho-3-hexuloisomerase [Propionicimonas sp.]|uniref:6-phospho-3-hexuloisomerase n=1 Tax=Propionicimonas sp. TaxID=1955623 RepID=UPI002B1FC00C|nr:6-phospho-3-hexuloisomerase [Propionicimonas sp.]MEA4942895.1 6-phospho-3-hexuloisomerase [Propionicimonas sp.]MEA5054712.1 6-phospho-3-hexuloisomerase [Propionicimonas sp.]MEA5118241.1 6-phospho-3-hexuloisomerase [Propionicimonas sp.]
MTGRIVDYARGNVAELAAVVDTVDEQVLQNLVAAIVGAQKVYLSGIGRSGLSARAVAMRLMHIGIQAYAVGEIATPGIEAGDLFIAVSATGRGSLLEQARVADKVGAPVAAITTKPDGELQQLAGVVLVLPVRSQVPTEQHAGSLFEQSALVVGDAVCRAVQERLGVPESELDRRHANLS